MPPSDLTPAPDLVGTTGEAGRVILPYAAVVALLGRPNRPDGGWSFVGGNGGAFLLTPDPASPYVAGDGLIDSVSEWPVSFPDDSDLGDANRALVTSVFGPKVQFR